MTREELLMRLGAVRDAIEEARTVQDTASLFRLAKERDDLRSALEEIQAPSKEQLVGEIESLRARLAAFDPESGTMTRLASGGGGPEGHAVSAANIVAAKKAEAQQMEDSGYLWMLQRIAHLEERLRSIDR